MIPVGVLSENYMLLAIMYIIMVHGPPVVLAMMIICCFVLVV
jgi:hypothetical protein